MCGFSGEKNKFIPSVWRKNNVVGFRKIQDTHMQTAFKNVNIVAKGRINSDLGPNKLSVICGKLNTIRRCRYDGQSRSKRGNYT